jgi:hypothetical protein
VWHEGTAFLKKKKPGFEIVCIVTEDYQCLRGDRDDLEVRLQFWKGSVQYPVKRTKRIEVPEQLYVRGRSAKRNGAANKNGHPSIKFGSATKTPD